MRLVYRRMRDDDRSFVIGTWLSSLRRSAYAGMIGDERWKGVMVPEIEAVLARPHIRTLVLADPAVTDHVADLFGHIAWEDASDRSSLPLVFYVYVKHLYRGRGFARGLLQAAGIDPVAPFNFVCRTYAINSLCEANKLPRARWRPLLGRIAEGPPDDDGREDREDPA